MVAFASLLMEFEFNHLTTSLIFSSENKANLNCYALQEKNKHKVKKKNQESKNSQITK